MKKRILKIQNIITLLIFITIIPSIIAQQQNESNYTLINESNYTMMNNSNYYPTINESNYYLPIQDSKNEMASQANESANFSIGSTFSFAEELIGERSYETISLRDEKVMAVGAANKKINIEPILKKVI